MGTFIKRNALPIVVFITGACVLVVEIVATRILSPFYGNTIYSVSSIISVILAALSVGYYVGGKLADRHPSLIYFYGLILLSGLSLVLFHFIGVVLLPILGTILSIATGPLLSSILLFFFPAFIMGMLSPYAVTLQSHLLKGEGIGSVSGVIFFWSTLGSISGSLLAGFVLIPLVGVHEIMIGVSAVLFMLGLLPLVVLGYKKNIDIAIILFVFFASTSVYITQAIQVEAVYRHDGLYERITIYDGKFEGRPTRFLAQDLTMSAATHLDSTDPTDLVFDYTRYYSLYDAFEIKPKRVLSIGGGAYSIPKALIAELPDVEVDVVEIEPELYERAKEFFFLEESDRLRNHVMDGRRFLHDSSVPYDIIFSDVYYTFFSIPTHFTTKEFFTLAKEKLSPDGLFIGNFIGNLSTKNPSFIESEMKTFKEVFPNSYFFAVVSTTSDQPQNIMFVGVNSDAVPNFLDPKLTTHTNAVLRELHEKMIPIESIDFSDDIVFTDNYAPVEYYTGHMLQKTFSYCAKTEELTGAKSALCSAKDMLSRLFSIF